ncbi:MAG TPA: hypothetical protein VMU24_08575 [Candidatus Acidoferrales bacterium]|nr:hypothetical protein [Candidatus Acidoferrales bacterium]
MRLRRRHWALIVVLAVLAALALAVVLRRHAPPEPVRLLPEGDAVLYVNLKNVRRLTDFNAQPVANREPSYDRFIRETGIEWERDLDEAAVAVHSGIANGQNRYSEVMTGHFDSDKLSRYLRSISRSVETYRQIDIYSIPVEQRTVRVALLGLDGVGASNVDDASVIHGIIDRHKKAALPFSGPSIVQDHYKDVPFGSLAWVIGTVPTPRDPRKARTLSLPGGIDIFVPAQSAFIGSVRVLTAIHAKFELIASNENDAHRFTEQVQTLLTIFQGIQASTQPAGSDPDVKAVFSSLKIEQKNKSAVISAEIPVNFLRKLVTNAPGLGGQPEQQPNTAPAPQPTPAPAKPNAPKKK